jgi:hypothetical protein
MLAFFGRPLRRDNAAWNLSNIAAKAIDGALICVATKTQV